jgi:O-antigen ligase
MLKEFGIISIILLFLWVSFFPYPGQANYHLATNLFLIFVFLTLLIKKRFAIFKKNDYSLWIFLLAMSINILFAQQKNIALKAYLNLAIPMFSIYYLVSASLSSATFNLLAKIICLSSILVSLGAVFESIFAFNPIYEYFIDNPFYLRYITDFVRPMSTQFNPVVLGSYLLASLPFNFLLFKQDKAQFKLLGALGIVLNTVVLILTFSRGVCLGFIAMVTFYLLLEKKYRLMIVFLIFLFIFISLCFYLPYPFERFGTGLIASDWRGIFSEYRFHRCIMTQHIIKDHPLAGLGFQHFRINFYQYYPGKDIVPFEFMIADNMYLTILAEAGIIGFIGFLIFIVHNLTRAWRQIAILNKELFRRKQLVMILCSLVGLLVNMGAYELFYWPNPYIYFCILLGCLKAYCEDNKKYDF